MERENPRRIGSRTCLRWETDFIHTHAAPHRGWNILFQSVRGTSCPPSNQSPAQAPPATRTQLPTGTGTSHSVPPTQELNRFIDSLRRAIRIKNMAVATEETYV